MRQLTGQLWWINELAPAAGVYLWQDVDGLILFDCGMPWHARAILTALSQAGFAPTQVRYILITHGDIDHIGGARALKEATRAALVCHAVTGAIMQGRLQRTFGLGFVGTLPGLISRVLMGPIFHSIPVRADELVIDGAALPGGFKAIYTPGHCAGHLAFYHPEARVLIAGDALSHHNGRLALGPALFIEDHVAALRSLARLARLDVEILCCGHGEPILREAQAKLRQLCQSLGAG
ncbi:MAG: MBL fold metallo-hydrolase [Anaerolineae bacterium]|nr:MBL fold metallo-hydrolase [Anaerolineae bacterium]MDW8100280.1 MBL fold metallo-hydrolase [Anaerolineae bacterium]